MGVLLNSKGPLKLYRNEAEGPYFVDKSLFFAELFPLINSGKNNICITRPRRFGKSVNASMVGAFFGKGVDSSCVFDSLKIARHPQYRQYLNQYNVIYIDCMKIAGESNNYESYITMITQDLLRDLKIAFPETALDQVYTPSRALNYIYEQTEETFLLIIDEWDCIFHEEWSTDQDRKNYTRFLTSLTKGSSYLNLTYMTGVHPIAKHSVSSTLNHFAEYSMGLSSRFGEYFGFTETEVHELYLRHKKIVGEKAFSEDALTQWYDGYLVEGKENVYNPRSVVMALTENKIASYWTQTGQFNEIAQLILLSVDGLQSAVAEMVDGGAVPVIFQEDAAVVRQLDTRDRILSAMVVYGFLTYDAQERTVRIPNRELMLEFENTILTEPRVGYLNRLAAESGKVLQATLDGDADAVAKTLERIHLESPLLQYNSEAELSHIVWIAYLSAQDRYTVQREMQGGRGRTDHTFLPKRASDPGFIVEVKMNSTPEAAVDQIVSKGYKKVFQNPLGTLPEWKCSKILAVGISYSTSTGAHSCKIAELPLD